MAAFRRRARDWIASNVPRAGEVQFPTSRERVDYALGIQQRIFDAGFAGITWPEEFGGQELTTEHMHGFISELKGYESPYRTLSISIGVVGPTLLELGTAEQKAQHLPALLRGDHLWVQLFSEPSGGSDVAGALTRATRDGDDWVLNGSKVWTTFGHYADYCLCLARTNWQVQKHAGLSMFVVDMKAPGFTVGPLKQASGASEFCEEFLEDVRVPQHQLLGVEGEGWAVASRVLMHERTALGGGSAYFAGFNTDDGDSGSHNELVGLALRAGLWGDTHVRQRVAEHHAMVTVAAQLGQRVAAGIGTGAFAGAAGSMLKLFTAEANLLRSDLTLALLGSSAAAWSSGDDAVQQHALGWLVRQGGSIAGGTNEIQRNIVSERVLQMPREPAPDKELPFNQVRTNRPGDGT